MTDPSHQEQDRVFLVVVDDNPEMRAALRFACMRAKSTGGRVALLRCLAPAEFQHWMGVGEIMREEARTLAEQLIADLSDFVVEISGQIPAVYLREGNVREELLALIAEEPSISILVLGAGIGKEGPGPLISYITGKGAASMRIPLTIVPGNLSDAEIDAIT